MTANGTCDCRACRNEWADLTGIDKERLERRKEQAVAEEWADPPVLSFAELLDRLIESCRGDVE